MASKNLHDLFIEEMRDIHSAERQLEKALPKMAKAAHDEKLKEAFELHREETQGQIERLDQAFELLNGRSRSRGKKCEAMEGLISEAKEMMEMELDPLTLDAALISAAQKAEHYEIASYGTLVAMAKAMDHKEVAKLLEETLKEEKATDDKLTKIAQPINKEGAKKAHPEPAKRSQAA